MAKASRLMRAEGFTHATLWVLATNTPSRGFYEHQGWSADGASQTEMIDDFELQERALCATGLRAACKSSQQVEREFVRRVK